MKSSMPRYCGRPQRLSVELFQKLRDHVHRANDKDSEPLEKPAIFDSATVSWRKEP